MSGGESSKPAQFTNFTEHLRHPPEGLRQDEERASGFLPKLQEGNTGAAREKAAGASDDRDEPSHSETCPAGPGRLCECFITRIDHGDPEGQLQHEADQLDDPEAALQVVRDAIHERVIVLADDRMSHLHADNARDCAALLRTMNQDRGDGPPVEGYMNRIRPVPLRNESGEDRAVHPVRLMPGERILTAGEASARRDPETIDIPSTVLFLDEPPPDAATLRTILDRIERATSGDRLKNATAVLMLPVGEPLDWLRDAVEEHPVKLQPGERILTRDEVAALPRDPRLAGLFDGFEVGPSEPPPRDPDWANKPPTFHTGYTFTPGESMQGVLIIGADHAMPGGNPEAYAVLNSGPTESITVRIDGELPESVLRSAVVAKQAQGIRRLSQAVERAAPAYDKLTEAAKRYPQPPLVDQLRTFNEREPVWNLGDWMRTMRPKRKPKPVMTRKGRARKRARIGRRGF